MNKNIADSCTVPIVYTNEVAGVNSPRTAGCEEVLKKERSLQKLRTGELKKGRDTDRICILSPSNNLGTVCHRLA